MDLIYHYLQIVLLGIVEGVTEFLPISSTGHLLIAEHLLGTQEPDIFNVVIQAGAILAVVFIYWQKLIALLTHLQDPEARAYVGKVLVSFVVTTIAYLVISKIIGHHKLTESLSNVAWATLIGGVVIFAVEFFIKRLETHETVSWFEAVLVGFAQVVAAIFPGTSRSGATIMSGLSVGMKRTVVTEFSFIVGIPTMFAASFFATFKSYKAGELSGLGHQIIIDTAIGFVVSMVVAFFVVKWLLRFVVSHTFNGFAIYRVILGGGLLIALYTGAIADISKEKAADALPEKSQAGEVTTRPPVAKPAPIAPGATETTPDAAPIAPLAPATNSTPVVPLTPTTDAPPVQPLAPATDAPPVAPAPPAP